jgi:thiosulfate/3-mercaptopyruvate sulfurtransferase
MAVELLVSTAWLAKHLENENIRVIDIRGYVRTTRPAPGVEQATYEGARAEYVTAHIPGAVYVD